MCLLFNTVWLLLLLFWLTLEHYCVDWFSLFSFTLCYLSMHWRPIYALTVHILVYMYATMHMVYAKVPLRYPSRFTHTLKHTNTLQLTCTWLPPTSLPHFQAQLPSTLLRSLHTHFWNVSDSKRIPRPRTMKYHRAATWRSCAFACRAPGKRQRQSGSI